jgi:hypothetical protein
MSKHEFTRYVDGVPVKDRTPKLASRKGRMKLNGRSLKRLLNERAAKAQRGTPSR